MYKTGDKYYLYCESVLLNYRVYWGLAGEYTGDLPTIKDVSEDTVELRVESRIRNPELGDNQLIPRKTTKSITLIPLDQLPDLLIDEIKKSKIDIGNSIVIKKDNDQWRFDGSTYSLNIHGCDFLDRSNNLIKISDDEYWIKVNPGDHVIHTHTDNRGYPASCGTDNKNKDVIMIVKWTHNETSQLEKSGI